MDFKEKLIDQEDDEDKPEKTEMRGVLCEINMMQKISSVYSNNNVY